MKTKQELDQIKKQVEEFNNKLSELSQDELRQVTAGVNIWDIAVKLKESIKPLSEKDIESVAGGTSVITEMKCLNCGHTASWLGNFQGQVFYCEVCHFHTFTSVREEIPEEKEREKHRTLF